MTAYAAQKSLVVWLTVAILKSTVESQIIVMDKPGPFYLPTHPITPDGQTYYIPDIQIEFDILLHNTSVSGQIFHLGKPHDYLYWYPIIFVSHYSQFKAGWTEPAEDLKSGNKYRIQDIQFPFFVTQWQHIYCRFNTAHVHIKRNDVVVWNQVIADPFILTTDLDGIWDIFIGGDSQRSAPNATMANIKVTSMAPLLYTLIPTTADPTKRPTNFPTNNPSSTPTNLPSHIPTNTPSKNPTNFPTNIPTNFPTNIPTNFPTNIPINVPTNIPTNTPTNIPTNIPSNNPTNLATKSTSIPTHKSSIEVITSTKHGQQTQDEHVETRSNADTMIVTMIAGFSFLFCIIIILVFVVIKLVKTKQSNMDIQMKEIGATYIEYVPPVHVNGVIGNNYNSEGNGDGTALLPPIVPSQPSVKEMYTRFVNQEFSDDSETESGDVNTKPGETDGYGDNFDAQLINDINTIK